MKHLFKEPVNFIVSGVGGQGNVMISLIVGGALVDMGYYVAVGETYGSSQRGGSVMSHVRISANKQYGPLIPEGQAHIILGMEPVETVRMFRQFGNEHVVTIVNPRPIPAVGMIYDKYPEIPVLLQHIRNMSAKIYVVNATEEAQKLGNPILANMVLIGALVETSLLPIEEKDIRLSIEELFPKAIDINMKALKLGREIVHKQAA